MSKNQSASGLTNFIQYDRYGNIKFVSGSNTLMTISASGAITTTGTISGSAAANATSASYALVATSATTASYADALTVKGAITAQTLVVQTITSSVDYVTGSTIWGSKVTDSHQITGSLLVTGSFAIGTTTNASRTAQILQYSGSSSALRLIAATGANSLLEFLGDGASSQPTIGVSSTSPNDLQLSTGGSEKMRINPSGSVGIGTTLLNWNYGLLTPLQIRNASIYSYSDYELGIQTNAYYDSSWKYQSTNTSNLFQITLGNGNAIKFNYATSGSANSVFTWTEAMRITPTGAVGIGTIAPAYTLDVSGSGRFSSNLKIGGGTLSSWATVAASEVLNAGFYGFASNVAGVSANAYYNGGWKYMASNTSARYELSNGTHLFYTSTSGTAGTALSESTVLSIASTGAATFSSADNSGARTTINDVLTIYQTNNSTPYSGFGSAILFKGTTYNSGGSGVPGTRNWGRIGMYLTDSSFNTTGENMYFAVASADNSDTLTTAMTIRYNGNVGIGTTNPTGQLSLANQISNGTDPISSYAATSGVSGQNFLNGYYVVNSDGLGTYPRYLDIASVGSPDGSNGGSNIRFFTNPIANNSPAIERMRIKSDGNVQIGSQNSTVTATLAISRDGAYPTDVSPASLSLCGATDSRMRMSLGYDTTNNYGWINSGQWGVQWTSLYIQKTGGALYGGSSRLDNNSDIRIKDNIQPITGALDKVLSMTGKKFHLLDEPESKIRLGFIAQELQGVVDELVIESDRTQTLPSGEVVENVLGLETWGSSWAALLVEAVKELKAQNDTLTERITALENK